MITVAGDKEALFSRMANDMAEAIKPNQTTVMIVPVGPTAQYGIFAHIINERKISLKNTWFINMDEYLNDDDTYIDITHPMSFRGFMQTKLYDLIDYDLIMPEEQRVFPCPINTTFIKELVARLGGIDVCFGGIGLNGHIAFNEPIDIAAEEFIRLETRALSLNADTIKTNAIDGIKMPTRCITIGMSEIFSAAKIRLYCFRDWHKGVCEKAAHGEISGKFPASVLRLHSDAKIIVSNDVVA